MKKIFLELEDEELDLLQYTIFRARDKVRDEKNEFLTLGCFETAQQELKKEKILDKISIELHNQLKK